jgi:hypothetical protein
LSIVALPWLSENDRDGLAEMSGAVMEPEAGVVQMLEGLCDIVRAVME